MVTSLTKAARSQGTSVCVGMAVLVGDPVGSGFVGSGGGGVSLAGRGGSASPTADVSLASTVCAAKVGKGFSVALRPGKLHAPNRRGTSRSIQTHGRDLRDMANPPEAV